MAIWARMMQATSPLFGRHGGRVDDAARLFPDAPTPWLDLSTGINPLGWTPPAGLATDLGPLPTAQALGELEQAAAGYFGVPADWVAAVPGSEIALRLLPGLIAPQPITALSPSYGTHLTIAARLLPADPPGTDWGEGALLLANPGNPLGARLSRARMAELAARATAKAGWLIVDEAFADSGDDISLLPRLSAGDRVIVLRSFGKFFGLGGLRLGFLVSPTPVVAALRTLLGDWPVSTQALLWGAAAYRDSGWIARTRARLHEEARALDDILYRHGLYPEGDCPLFRLVRDCDAQTLFRRLARAGILLRPFADQPRWLRFGLPGDAAALARLDAALGNG